MSEVLSRCLPSFPASGDVQSSVRYDLALDPGRLIPRAVFEETKNWTLTRRKILGLGDHCETVKLFLPVRTLEPGRGRRRRRRSPRLASGTLFPAERGGKGGETGAGQRAVAAREPGSTAGLGHCVTIEEKPLGWKLRIQRVGSPSGLCGGCGEPHHPAPQLLPGGGAHPLIPEPLPCAGCGLAGPLHCFCESSNKVPGMC